MASLHKRKSGPYVIFVYACGKQLTIYPGTSDKREVERFLDHVQGLEDAARAGRPVSHVTSAWVDQLLHTPAASRQYDSLARAGLVHSRESLELARRAVEDDEQQRLLRLEADELAAEAKNITIAGLTAQFIATLAHVKPSTVSVYKSSSASLVEHFGSDRRIGSVTAADAEACRKWMLSRYSKATVSKRVKHANAFFRSAVDGELITANPFQAVRAGRDTNPERQRYVPHDTVRRVIDAASDEEWRLIIGLAYYAGLRVPSEIFSLEWADVDRRGGTFKVATPKTMGHGRAQKRLPIFPELAELFDAVEPAARGNAFVVAKHRLSGGNLSTQVRRFIKAAGLKPWPKLFNNLRASRRNDLARMGRWPEATLSEWFGHDAATANAYYMMTTEDDYKRAAATPTEAQGHAQGRGGEKSKNEARGRSAGESSEERYLRIFLEKHGLSRLLTASDHCSR